MYFNAERLRAIEKAVGHEAKASVSTGNDMRPKSYLDVECKVDNRYLACHCPLSNYYNAETAAWHAVCQMQNEIARYCLEEPFKRK